MLSRCTTRSDHERRDEGFQVLIFKDFDYAPSLIWARGWISLAQSREGEGKNRPRPLSRAVRKPKLLIQGKTPENRN
jgi:hypothetical protein